MPDTKMAYKEKKNKINTENERKKEFKTFLSDNVMIIILN